jgi:ferredoxin
MASTGNGRGRYFIGSECDGCGACVACAPDNVVPGWDGSHCVVAHQPANAREERDLHDAEMTCPLACLRREEAPARSLGGGSDRAMGAAQDRRRQS